MCSPSLLTAAYLGKQLFEQQKVSASSDAAFYAESGISIDEVVFDGLEDLEIDDEEQLDWKEESSEDE